MQDAVCSEQRPPTAIPAPTCPPPHCHCLDQHNASLHKHFICIKRRSSGNKNSTKTAKTTKKAEKKAEKCTPIAKIHMYVRVCVRAYMHCMHLSACVSVYVDGLLCMSSAYLSPIRTQTHAHAHAGTRTHIHAHARRSNAANKNAAAKIACNRKKEEMQKSLNKKPPKSRKTTKRPTEKKEIKK